MKNEETYEKMQTILNRKTREIFKYEKKLMANCTKNA